MIQKVRRNRTLKISGCSIASNIVNLDKPIMNEYEVFVKTIIRNYKVKYFENPKIYSIPLNFKNEQIGRLRPIPIEIKGDAINDVTLQTKWRNMHKDSFLVEPFIATDERTLRWLNETYFTNDDRIIFMIEDIDHFCIGHLGFENFIYNEKKCEYGRLIRGVASPIERLKRVNIIKLAQIAFLNWGFNYLKLDMIYGTQFADNWAVNKIHAICGFTTVKEYPFEKNEGVVMLADKELKKENFKLLS